MFENETTFRDMTPADRVEWLLDRYDGYHARAVAEAQQLRTVPRATDADAAAARRHYTAVLELLDAPVIVNG